MRALCFFAFAAALLANGLPAALLANGLPAALHVEFDFGLMVGGSQGAHERAKESSER